MNYIPMRLRVLIAIAVLLTPLVIWRIVSTGDAAPDMSPEEIAIREDRLNGNVEGLVEKVKTYPPKFAKKAVRNLGPGGARSLPFLNKIMLEDKRPEIRQHAAQAAAQAIQVATPKDEPLDERMTDALVTVLSSDKSPEVRAKVASVLGQLYDYNNMASLLKAMDDEHLAVRRKAFEAVTRIFARRYKFKPDGASDKRKAVIQLIAEDWKVYKTHVGEYHDRHRKSSKRKH